MINRTPHAGNAVVRREPRAAVLAPFRDLLGFDPFRDALSSWNVEYGVTRTEQGYEVEVPVPGFKPDDIDVTYQERAPQLHAVADRAGRRQRGDDRSSRRARPAASEALAASRSAAEEDQNLGGLTMRLGGDDVIRDWEVRYRTLAHWMN
jgi:hypothetical protein